MNTAPKPFAARAMDSVPKNGRKTITGYAQDADGDALTFTPLNPVNASLVQLNTKTVLFVPAKDFTGTASFTWQIEDGKGGVATQDVIVEVFPSSFTYRPIIIGAGEAPAPVEVPSKLDSLLSRAGVDVDRLAAVLAKGL
jgi:hypothetical protein